MIKIVNNLSDLESPEFWKGLEDEMYILAYYMEGRDVGHACIIYKRNQTGDYSTEDEVLSEDLKLNQNCHGAKLLV